MARRDWLSRMWNEGEENLHALRKQIDTLFEDFDKGFVAQSGEISVRTNVSETNKEICITAELPGIEKDDVDVEISGDKITIKGEKKSEKDEKGEEDGRKFHRIERSSGAFLRRTRLPFEIDPASVTADVKNGVLTVTIPKPAEEQSAATKVDIKGD